MNEGDKIDLMIRGGTVLDGTGSTPFVGDVALKGDRIVAVGDLGTVEAAEVMDAQGLLVCPGWVDIHTHYDGQATWDRRIQPSSLLGTTTVVMGNCGVGFAPVRPQDHGRLISLMEGVEDIPGTALHAGLAWNWESFPDYLDALAALPRDIDIAAQVPHSALRVYVMGERGANREFASADEIETMGQLVQEAVKAGALGFSTSRVLFHRTADGELAPSVGVEHAELVGIARAMGSTNSGVLQIAASIFDDPSEFQLLLDMIEVSGRPLSFSFVEAQDGTRDEMLAKLEAARAKGIPITAQVQGRSIGLLLCLAGSVHPFITRPSYMEIAHLPMKERLALLRTPEVKARILSEASGSGHPFIEQCNNAWDRMFELGNPPQYEPNPANNLASRAAERGMDAQELVYDLLTSGDGTNFLYFPMMNFMDGNYDSLLPVLKHAHTVPGLSDGGAHVGVICDASVSTYMLSHWCRDRSGERLDLADVVRRQARESARAVGLLDRGVIAPGYRADINLIDFDKLQLQPPHMVFDLPAGERRLNQGAYGYVATLVAGRVTYRNGEATGELPGKLIRGAQPAPVG